MLGDEVKTRRIVLPSASASLLLLLHGSDYSWPQFRRAGSAGAGTLSVEGDPWTVSEECPGTQIIITCVPIFSFLPDSKFPLDSVPQRVAVPAESGCGGQQGRQ